MREPQATSALGAGRRLLNRVMDLPRRRVVAVLAATTLTASVLCPARAHAQFGRQQAPSAPSFGWWLSAVGAAVTIRDISDGASQSLWSFGTDPTWQGRASIEKALDEFTTIGIVGGYARTSLMIRPLAGGDSTKLPEACQTECPSSAEIWTAMAQFRSGGGEGFHTFFEANGGATAFRNFKTKSDGLPITAIKNSVDLSGTVGLGFGYSLSPSKVLTLVQDVGIGLHSKDGLPEGTSRSWKSRTTRVSLRLKFGGR